MVNSRDIDWPMRLAEAQTVVQTHLDRTPLVRVDLGGFDPPTYLKLESLHPTGSFKVRGALAAVATAARDGRPVVTASAGNHGLGVAFAATRLNARATVVVPENASTAKVEALRRFDIDLLLVGDRYDAAEQAALRIAEQTNAEFISAYTHPDVIAGQATVVGEVAEQVVGPFRIVVPVGGGGLAAGTALGAPARASVIGVEAQASRAVSASMRAGRVIDVDVEPTIADGLAGNVAADTITPRILSQHGVRCHGGRRGRDPRGRARTRVATWHRRGGVRRRRHRRGRGRQHSRRSTDRVRHHRPQHRRQPSRRTTRGMITPGPAARRADRRRARARAAGPCGGGRRAGRPR